MVHCKSRALSGNVYYDARQWEHLAPVPSIPVCSIPAGRTNGIGNNCTTIVGWVKQQRNPTEYLWE
ncbi:MAG: hypothetical protein O4859_25085 [Trichodesmium sp. St18_bin1]|nr:hypothetical protein [Trichodesmium sp. St18_bin1]